MLSCIRNFGSSTVRDLLFSHREPSAWLISRCRNECVLKGNAWGLKKLCENGGIYSGLKFWVLRTFFWGFGLSWRISENARKWNFDLKLANSSLFSSEKIKNLSVCSIFSFQTKLIQFLVNFNSYKFLKFLQRFQTSLKQVKVHCQSWNLHHGDDIASKID